MDKNTLSNYGWIVIAVLVLSVMMALATPFGNYIKSGIASTTIGLYETEYNAFKAIGVDVGKNKMDNVETLMSCKHPDTTTYDDDKKCNHCGYIIYGNKTHNGLIPEGASYEFISGDILYEGDEFPNEVNSYDKYIYGDYSYTYATTSGVKLDDWSAMSIKKNKTKYEPIVDYINNKPVVKARQCFLDNKNLVISPIIPDTIIDMSQMFDGCESLTTITNIPEGVVYLQQTFANCDALQSMPQIPSTVQDMKLCFYGCDSLKTVTSLAHCKNLTVIYSAFYNCKTLKDASAMELPNTEMSASSLFKGCVALEKAPAIPEKAVNINSIFEDCLSLTQVTINTDTTQYTNCIKNTNVSEVLGNTIHKSEILATK